MQAQEENETPRRKRKRRTDRKSGPNTANDYWAQQTASQMTGSQFDESSINDSKIEREAYNHMMEQIKQTQRKAQEHQLRYLGEEPEMANIQLFNAEKERRTTLEDTSPPS